MALWRPEAGEICLLVDDHVYSWPKSMDHAKYEAAVWP